MLPQGILYGHILSVFATIASGLWFATQSIASQGLSKSRDRSRMVAHQFRGSMAHQ